MNVSRVGFTGKFVKQEQHPERFNSLFSEDDHTMRFYNSRVIGIEKKAKELPPGDQLTLTSKPVIVKKNEKPDHKGLLATIFDKHKEEPKAGADILVHVTYTPGKNNPDAKPEEVEVLATQLGPKWHNNFWGDVGHYDATDPIQDFLHHIGPKKAD